MRKRIYFLIIILVLLITGCASYNVFSNYNIYTPPPKTAEAYLELGRLWGHRHYNKLKIKPKQIDLEFVKALIGPNLDFFWINTDLKQAFKKGYRLGYEDRIADLVLGPHLERAAIEIGEVISKDFVSVIDTFETNWVKTLRRAIDIFIVLIAEGSQADREGFINKFTDIYNKKYLATYALIHDSTNMFKVSEGGTLLYIDMKKVRAVLKIPTTDSLKTEIYQQTFKVMGDEMGQRYSHNLIDRNELIEWLRRSKTALEEIKGNNLGIIYCAFAKSYGTDAGHVFIDLVNAAGFDVRIVHPDCK